MCIYNSDAYLGDLLKGLNQGTDAGKVNKAIVGETISTPNAWVMMALI